MNRLKRLIVEIHRRSLWQVLTVYLISSWIALQVADTVTAVLGLPDWVPSVALVLLIVLLPVVLATAFVQEGVGSAARAEPVPEGEPRPEIPAPEPRGAHHRVLTWRNAIIAAVGMLVLLTLSAGGYMGLRAAGIGPFGTLMSKGMLQERDRIVLADFENRTPDSLMAMAATELFRTALSQSPVVSVADQEYVAGVLSRMEREPDTPLDYHLAREVAVRQGLKAVTAGEVIAVGGSYVVSARLVAAETGEELWTDSETARDSTAIIDSIDRLSRRLRERIGESLRTIRANEPLEKVTTGSLDALRKYSQAVRAIDREGDEAKGLALLEEAVALDTALAAAYRAIAVTLSNRFQERARYVEMSTKAFEHRDRLTERERYMTLATYYSIVTGDREKEITAYRSLLDIYPDDAGALNNLSNLYWDRRDYARAEGLYLRSLEQDSLSWVPYANLIQTQVALGKFDAAQATLDRMDRNLPGHPRVDDHRAGLASSQGDYEAAEAHLQAVREAGKGSLFYRAMAGWDLAAIARVRGQLAEAERHLRDVMATNEERRLAAGYLNAAIQIASLDIWFRGAPAAGLTEVESSLRRHPLETIASLDRPYLGLANLYSFAGLPDRAKALVTEFEQTIDPELRRGAEPWRHLSLGLIGWAEGRADDALTELRLWDEDIDCAICALPFLGLAYDLAGDTDSLIAVYERYVTTPWMWRAGLDSYNLAMIYERLGVLYEQRGDTAKAVYYYGKFVELWNDADPELQPRVEAARRAIEALSPDR